MSITTTFTAQQSLFRAYDIRGKGHYFTSAFIAVLGEVFAKLYQSQSYYNQSCQLLERSITQPAKTIVIGYDVRFGSDIIAKTLIDILHKRGLVVVSLGLVTTPMMAFWAQQYDGHGIMVTASHSAKDILGIKWLLDNTSPSSLEIQTLYQQLSHYHLSHYNSKLRSWPHHDLHRQLQNFNYSHDSNAYSKANKICHSLEQHGTKQSCAEQISTEQRCSIQTSIEQNNVEQTNVINLPSELISSGYSDAIAQSFININSASTNRHAHDAKLDLTIVIDCMDGATSVIAQSLFERFCQRVIMLNNTPDGSFPTGNPDPTEPNRLAELQQAVIFSNADMGFAFDGDGDRLMVVDNSGKVIVADHLLYLLAQVAITERPANMSSVDPLPKVLFDIKCSHHLPQLLSKLGATPIMTRTGSSLLRQQLTSFEQLPIFAGELSGHFTFNDGYFIAYDDAIYASLRLLQWLTLTAPNLEIFTLRPEDRASSNALKTDVWGESREAIPPYQLTDITQGLPIAVSSADHYLPLDETFLTKNDATSCTFIEHLVEYCRYLQRLVNDSTANDLSTQKAVFTESISCRCIDAKPPMLKTKTVAQQLFLPETSLSSIDGIRLDFAHGFGVVRRSNTSNCLTVRFAGDNLNEMRAIQARFVAICRLFDRNVAEQMANIQPEHCSG
ncbi:MAG: phosphomannomutase [Psychrobacter sp.]|nr:phosphomannomutase [Psychrobacter sp.]